MAIKIVTDSTSYIPNDLINDDVVQVVSLNVLFGEETYKELEMANDVFYKKMEAFSGFPTTTQPSAAEFIEVFEEMLKEGHEIIGIFISSKISGTVASANVAKTMLLESYPDAVIELIDSNTTAMELGFAVLEATRLVSESKSVQEIVVTISNFKKRSRLIFTPQTLEYLEKGGRIGKARALLAETLHIKPILTVVDGEVDIKAKVRTHKKSVAEMISIMKKDLTEHGYGGIVILHINCSEEAQAIAEQFRETMGDELNDKEIRIVPMGPVVGVHVGPGTVGFAYYAMEALD